MTMWVFVEVSKILSSPLGSLVYHLLLLLIIEAALGMAWEEWRRTRRGPAQRLLIGFGGLGLVRVAYLAAALLAMAGWVNRTVLLPPFERFADTASLTLLAWALAPAPLAGKANLGSSSSPAPLAAVGVARWWRPRAWNLLLAANLVLAIAACVTAVILWGQDLAANPRLDYNLSWQAIVWSGWQIGLALLLGLAAITAGTDREESRVMPLLAVVVALAGRSIQLLSALGIISTMTTPHLPAWDRLSNLIAYILLVIALYQTIVVGLRLRSRQFQAISQASMDQIKSLLFLFEAGREISGSLDLPTVLDNAAQGIARALDADQCAIAFPQDNDPGQMRLAAIYNPARHGRGEGVAFPLDYQLAVHQAMRRKRYVIVEEADNVQLKVLFALLGSSDIGPLLIQPLLSDNDTIGAIIVGNSRSQRPFTPNEAKLCQSMADQVVGAIQNARRYQALQAQNTETTRALADEHRATQQARAQTQELADRLTTIQTETEEIRRREQAAREARNALEIKLVSSRAESESLTDRLSMLESDLAQAHANTEAQLNWHKMEIARQEAAWHEALQAQERLNAILYNMTAGFIIADREHRIVEANVASEILLDRDTDQLKGTDLTTLSDDPRWKQAVLTASGGDAPAVRITIGVGSNSLLCDLAPIPGTEAGQDLAEGIVVVMQDVTAEMDESKNQGQLVAQIASKAVELQSSLATAANYANLVLSDMAIPATASAEGPRAQREAASVAGGTQRSAVGEAAGGQREAWSGGTDGPPEERTVSSTARKFLLRLRTSVERTAQMADDLVHLSTGAPPRYRSAGSRESRSGSAAEGPPEEWTDVNHLLETAVADSQPQFEDKALVLELDVPNRLPAVKVNQDDLRRAMANLLLNACLVSPTGGRIQVQAIHSNGPLAELGRHESTMPHTPGSNGNSFVIISVRDWGGGLPVESLSQVFDQARPDRTPQGLGASGADLALVKTLVESQRGHVWVETESGVGTTFTLALPIEKRG